MQALVTDDKIVFGLLLAILGLIYYTSSSKNKNLRLFYNYIPALLLCYLIPALFNTFGFIDGNKSGLYGMAKNYLLPGSLILMTMSIDMKAVLGLGRKALIMFATATFGVVIGGPIAVLIVSQFSPEALVGAGENEVWRGLATIAGSWIGGGANQSAMLELYQYNTERYSAMVGIDIIVYSSWMAVLLYGAARHRVIDKFLNKNQGSVSEIDLLLDKTNKIKFEFPQMNNLMVVLGLCFGLVGLSHFLGQVIVEVIDPNGELSNAGNVLGSNFFWLIVLSTTFGLLLSFTRAKKLEKYGTMNIGSLFIYVLVATIGMKMDISTTFDNPSILFIALIWIVIHGGLLFLVAKLIKADFFYVAVGSMANIGGAASAPVVAAAFNPQLASVGVLLAVLGYAVGTYGAIACAEVMRMIIGAS